MCTSRTCHVYKTLRLKYKVNNTENVDYCIFENSAVGVIMS